MGFEASLQQEVERGVVKPQLAAMLQHVYGSYGTIYRSEGWDPTEADTLMKTYLEIIVEQLKDPYPFATYHACIRKPFDYFSFGVNFFKPLVDEGKSHIIGLEHIDTMMEQMGRGDNVILLANHQIEPDPQVLICLLLKTHPELAQKMIFVAGHRVTQDHLAAPLSKGLNLLCIYSKRHIENPPEHKAEKQKHNQKTMQRMSELLTEGGKCIFVAPSGGRDRPNAEGVVEVAPFDPQSIEMFRLMAKKSGRKTHFYPLSLATYALMPPPKTVEKDLGEQRNANRTPVGVSFGNEIDMDAFPGSDTSDKKMVRQNRAEHIWQAVCRGYRAVAKQV